MNENHDERGRFASSGGSGTERSGARREAIKRAVEKVHAESASAIAEAKAAGKHRLARALLSDTHVYARAARREVAPPSRRAVERLARIREKHASADRRSALHFDSVIIVGK